MFFLFPYSLETFGETKPHEVGVDSYHMIFFMSFTRPKHWSQRNYLASANESDQWCKQVQITGKITTWCCYKSGLPPTKVHSWLHLSFDIMCWILCSDSSVRDMFFFTNIPMLSYTYSNKMMFKCCCMSSGHWLSCFWAMCLHLASWWHWWAGGVPESGWKCPKSWGV